MEERKRVSKCLKKDSGRKKEGEQMLKERQWKKERGSANFLRKTVEGRKKVSKCFMKDSGRKKEGEQMLKKRQFKEE